MFRSAVRWAADLIMPRTCPGCDVPLRPAAPEAFCPSCQVALPVLEPPWCDRCGETPVTGTCARCRAGPPEFEVARASFRFAGPVREAVHALKFRGRRGAAVLLGRLMADRLAGRPEVLAGATLVVAVPLHPSRLRERGWDQAALIAEAAAAMWRIPFVPDAIVRSRMTPPQVGLDRDARRRNMERAFGPGPAASRLAGRTVILVDDVLTTGATVSAAAAAARAVGGRSIRVAAVARD